MVDVLWVSVQDALRVRLSTKDFDTWIRPLQPRTLEGECLTLETSSDFARDWLSRHLRGDVEAALAAAGHPGATVCFRVNRELAVKAPRPRPRQQTRTRAAASALPIGLQRYTFDNFVIGGSNAFAFRACRSVVEAPGGRFNPLVVHGGVGLGKTHLLSATAGEIIAQGRTAVRFVTAEQFVNDLVHAVRHDGSQRFRDRYRGIGVLIIDDVQFLAGKRRSQEEFIHTFNALRELGKQIILASDRPPEELTEMSPALRNRLASGLLAGIAAPDDGMRLALVQQKLGELGLRVASGVDEFLAGEAWTNVRELEGMILRFEAGLDGTGNVIDWAVVGRSGRAPGQTPPVDVHELVGAVCEEFHVRPADVASRRRTKAVSTARQVAMYLARETTDLSLQAIGDAIGGRDHSTVAHAVERIGARMEADSSLRVTVKRLETQVLRRGGAEWPGTMEGTGGARGTRKGVAGIEMPAAPDTEQAVAGRPPA